MHSSTLAPHLRHFVFCVCLSNPVCSFGKHILATPLAFSLRLSELMLVSGAVAVGDVLFRAEKEKQQVKIEVEQLKEQMENVGKAKVRKLAQST